MNGQAMRHWRVIWAMVAAGAAGIAAFVIWWRGRGKEPAFDLPPEPVAPEGSNAPDEPHEPPPPPPEPAPEPQERELAPVG
jgi:hypothetical protein